MIITIELYTENSPYNMYRTNIMKHFIMVTSCDLAFDLDLYLPSMTAILYHLVPVTIDCLTELGIAASDYLVSVLNII